MFGNYSNQKNDGVNVNTNFKVFFSDTAALSIGGWNTQFSIKMTPCVGVNANGIKNYDNNRKVNTAIVPEKAIALAKGIDDVIIPAIKNNEIDKSVSISMGTPEKRTILTVSYKNDEEGKPAVYLIFNAMIKEDNTADPSTVYSFKFNDVTYATDYNSETGSIGQEVVLFGEFLLFYEILRNFINLLPINAHNNKYATAMSAKFSSNYNKSDDKPAYEAPVSNDDGLPFL